MSNNATPTASPTLLSPLTKKLSSYNFFPKLSPNSPKQSPKQSPISSPPSKSPQAPSRSKSRPVLTKQLSSTSMEHHDSVKNKRDCSVLVKVFEARNLLQASIRRRESDKVNPPMKRAQHIIMDVTSPNLMTFADTTDPYCTVQLDQMRLRTRTIEKKLNPFWCEEFVIEVADPFQSKLVITVMDEKKYSQQDTPIGKIVIPINAVRDQREREQWIPLQPSQSTSKIPQLHVFINYTLEENHRSRFAFKVLGGRNLGITKPGTEPNIDITWRLKDNTAKSEDFDWNTMTLHTIERDLAAPLECVTLLLWRTRGVEQHIEYSDSDSNSAGSTSSIVRTDSSGSIGGDLTERYVLGSILIPVVDLSVARESWFCLYPKPELVLGDVRIKVKYTEEVVLPLENYAPLLEMLQEPTYFIVQTLGAVAIQNTRESIAYNLVRVFEKIDKGIVLLNFLTTAEIESTPNPDIIFRGNSLATKALDQYMKLIGMPYLHSVLQALIKRIYVSSRTCEVDPSKLEKGEDLKHNWKNLISWVEAVTSAIFKSLNLCPIHFREIFKHMRDKCLEKYPDDKVAHYTSVSGFIFLRFFCPAILAPKLFDLASDHPGIKQTRYLILIAKTLQNLANLVEFGGAKEEFMKDMNEFVVSHLDTMKHFIDELSSVPADASGGAELLKPINLEKELACMYRHIMKHRNDMMTHCAQGDEHNQEMMTKLNRVLTQLEADVIAAQNQY